MQSKIPSAFLAELDKTVLKSMCNEKGPVMVKAILGNKSKAGDITIADIKLYYKATVI